MVSSSTVKELARRAGFDLAGIAPIAAEEDLKFSRRWVEKGYGGQMHYLKNPKRDDPRRVLPSAKSAVCVGLVYNAPLPYSIEASGQCSETGSPASKTPDLESKRPVRSATREAKDKGVRAKGQGLARECPRAWISRYAWGRDYHQVIRAKLERFLRALELLSPGVETRVYVDTGPVVERALARFSGVGWMGKNTCLINQEKGSWFFLGVVLTSLELGPDLPAPDRCGSCTRCLDACPTGALVRPYMMDASRCIAYFNIELKGSIPEEFRPAIGSNVFGCDICQDVCPWNSKGRGQGSGVRGQGRGAATTALPEFQPLEVSPESRNSNPEPGSFSMLNPPLAALASISEEEFERVFAHSPIKRAKYRGWLRNLCVVMANSRDARFLPWLERAQEYPDPIVREHAEWAYGRIAGQKARTTSGTRSATDGEASNPGGVE
jgi:epoxyqueuosine reductase